jgi:hypothetical protein
MKQSNIAGFLNNVGQATMVTGLVEDIRDIIMHYQVCYAFTSGKG